MTFRWEIQRYHIKGLLGDESIQPDQRMSGEFNRIRAWACKKNRSKPNFQQVRRLTGLTLPPLFRHWAEHVVSHQWSMQCFYAQFCQVTLCTQKGWTTSMGSTSLQLGLSLFLWNRSSLDHPASGLGSVCKETENCDVNSLNKCDESNHVAHTSTYSSFRVRLAVNTLVRHWVFGHVFGDAGTTLETLNLALISPWRQQRFARSNFWALNNGPIVGRALRTHHQETCVRLSKPPPPTQKKMVRQQGFSLWWDRHNPDWSLDGVSHCTCRPPQVATPQAVQFLHWSPRVEGCPVRPVRLGVWVAEKMATLRHIEIHQSPSHLHTHHPGRSQARKALPCLLDPQ